MSTNITSDNGVEVEVCGLGIAVVNHEEETETWARLSDAQRVELAAALDPGRRGLHVRLDNQAKTLATFQRERDAAVARADQLRDERDEALSAGLEALRDAECDRDEWKARAEQAERERDQARDDERLHSWGRITRHPFFDRIQFASGTLTDAMIAALDAAMQPAPVVDRDVVEAELVNGLHRGFAAEHLARRVCAAIDSDPAVFVVRESDIAAVKVERDGDGHWRTDGDYLALAGSFLAVKPRECADKTGRDLIREIALARAIEAEQATDPVEEKARELYRAATPDARWETVADEYRRIARHVLGQEADQ